MTTGLLRPVDPSNDSVAGRVFGINGAAFTLWRRSLRSDGNDDYLKPAVCPAMPSQPSAHR